MSPEIHFPNLSFNSLHQAVIQHYPLWPHPFPGITLPAGALTPPPPFPLFGFVDLHAHPATHLAFGATEEGRPGLFWGRPGLRASSGEGTLAEDLPVCNGYEHWGYDDDWVRHGLRILITEQMSEMTAFSHGTHGTRSFQDWPHARSILHQQMHIQWIRRAHYGGLRVLVAAAMNNQLLSKIWNVDLEDVLQSIRTIIEDGIDISLTTLPFELPHDLKFNEDYDYQSARRQLRYISDMAAANSEWMEVVRDAQHAREVISSGKLAVVLSVEMDNLLPWQIISLKQEFHLRHITPIHFVNNEYGGTACDEKSTNFMFVLSNLYNQGSAFSFEDDLSLDFKKRNARGLDSPFFQTFMAEGMLLDLAHMSENAQRTAVEFARTYSYPMMDSHTGLRPDDQGTNERAIRHEHAAALSRLGGMLGLGTAVHAEFKPFWNRERINEMTHIAQFEDSRRKWKIFPSFTSYPPGSTLVDRLNITIVNGEDTLRDDITGTTLVDFLYYLGRDELMEDVREELNINRSAAWPAFSSHSFTIELVDDVRLENIRRLGIRANLAGGPAGDNWDIAKILVQGQRVDGSTFTLLEEEGLRLKGEQKALYWDVGNPLAPPPETPVSAVQLVLTTSEDGIDRGSELDGVLHLRDATIPFELNRGYPWGKEKTHQEIVTLDRIRPLNDITAIEFRFRETGLDNCYLNRLSVNVLEGEGDPVAKWAGYYLEALEVMGRRGIAFGTDFNGFEAQIPLSANSVDYPTHPVEPGPPPTGDEIGWLAPSLPQEISLDKHWDFHKDGLAHFGMLPDFIQALSQDPRITKQHLKPLFFGADSFVEMWEKTEKAAHSVRVRMEDGEGGTLVTLYSWYGERNRDNYTSSHPDWAGRPGDNKEEFGGYFCHRIEGAAFSPHHQPPPPGTIPLNMFWSLDKTDHVLTTENSVDVHGPPGIVLISTYSKLGEAGYIFRPDHPQPPGTIPLYRWYSNQLGDHISSTDPAWAGAPGSTRDIAGAEWMFERLEGYVISPVTGLYSWWNYDLADNYATTYPDWVGLPGYRKNNYDFFRLEGRIFKPDLPKPAGTNPVWHWWNGTLGDNFLATDPAWSPESTDYHHGYDYVGLLGYIFPHGPTPPAGTTPLRHWQNLERGDNFATSDPAFEETWEGGTVQGYTFAGILGHIYRA